MGRQKGIINLEGKVGNVSFFKTRDGYSARTSEGINGERVKNDEGYQRTRENGFEFGRAGKTSKLMRDALRPILINVADGRVASRLTTKILQVIKTDPLNDRGARIPKNGDLQLLKNFEFNVNAGLNQSILTPFATEVNRAAGTVNIQVQSFLPAHAISPPKGATHFKLVFGAMAVFFEQHSTFKIFHEVAPRPLGMIQSDLLAVAMDIPPQLAEPIFITAGIEFLQIVNNKEYPLKTASKNAMAIVEVNLA